VGGGGGSVGLGGDAEGTADGRAKRCPRRLQSLLIRGGSRVPRRQRGPRSNPGRRGGREGGSGPERAGERVVIVEAAGRSGAAPELAGSKCAAPEQGSSGRPVKKARVHSKM
jgi:hypothetical protein